MSEAQEVSNRRTLLPIVFNWQLFVSLCVGFILFTIIGTLSHEAGHYTVAKWFGYHPRINYAATYYNEPDTSTIRFLNEQIQLHRKEIASHASFPGSDKYYAIAENYGRGYIWMTMAGPIETMLTGTIGCAFIIGNGKRYYTSSKLGPGQWIAVFFALFWLRQLTNLVVGIGVLVLTHKWSRHSDEEVLARIWHLPRGTISGITGLIALVIATIIIFRIIPAKQRFTFISAGLLGGVAGYLLWLVWLGPVIMP